MSGRVRRFMHDAWFGGNGVARRLALAVVLFSSLVTAALTAIELYSAYRENVGQINRSLDFVTKSNLPALTDSVWIADGEQIRTQLEGLLHLRDLEYIAIGIDGTTSWTAGTPRSKRTVVAVAPLVREHRGGLLTIGTVRVVGSIDRVLDRLWSQLLIVLIGNAIKTALVVGFMLLVFQFLVTRHLGRVAEFVGGIDPAAPKGETLVLDRPASGRWRPDILDTVSAALSKLSRALAESRRELLRSTQRLETLTRETMAFIYELDRDGRILFVNRTRSGRPVAQVQGHLLSEWLPPASANCIEQALGRVFTLARVERVEYTTEHTGEIRTYVAALYPILADGRVGSAALTAVDISEQKAAENRIRALNSGLEQRVRERTLALERAAERAENANRAKSAFLSRMSHELRTPLNAMLGFAQLIEMSPASGQQHEWAGEIRNAGAHLLDLIEDLLDLGKIETGRMALRIEPINPMQVLNESIAIVRTLLEARNLQIAVNGVADIAVMADRLRLRQILLVLLTNAIKYNRDGGRIDVDISAGDDRVAIRIADTGIGIAPERLATLFQPFERLGAEHSALEGAGIGLALSAKLAELMRATMGVDSELGEGTRVRIELRVAEP